jgi:hypothetical protein
MATPCVHFHLLNVDASHCGSFVAGSRPGRIHLTPITAGEVLFENKGALL